MPDNQKLVTIYKTADALEAQVIKSLMESNGISCYLQDPLGSPYPMLAGEIEIQVLQEREAEALSILRAVSTEEDPNA